MQDVKFLNQSQMKKRLKCLGLIVLIVALTVGLCQFFNSRQASAKIEKKAQQYERAVAKAIEASEQLRQQGMT